MCVRVCARVSVCECVSVCERLVLDKNNARAMDVQIRKTKIVSAQAESLRKGPGEHSTANEQRARALSLPLRPPPSRVMFLKRLLLATHSHTHCASRPPPILLHFALWLLLLQGVLTPATLRRLGL